MDNPIPDDGLLRAARILTTIFMILLWICLAGLTIAIPVLLLNPSIVADAMLSDASLSPIALTATCIMLIVFGIIFFGLAIAFLRSLRQIIQSVGKGDPFIEENARRLNVMGCIAILIAFMEIPAGALATLISAQLEAGSLDIDISFSLTTLLAGLLLFILARIFRHGAAMREDLEGTV